MPAVAQRDSGFVIRAVREDDFAAIAEIYRPYVTDTAITFEIEPPDPAEMMQRCDAIRVAGAPYLVAEAAGRVVGYAFGRPYNEKAAYAWTLENSIYVDRGAQRVGVGSQLMVRLIEEATARGFRQMVALIAAGAGDASVAFHAAHGFALKGRLDALGFKHGGWHDVIYMQRTLGEGAAMPPGPVPSRS